MGPTIFDCKNAKNVLNISILQVESSPTTPDLIFHHDVFDAAPRSRRCRRSWPGGE